MKTLGIGMVGYGFIGKVHTLSYLNLPYYYKPMPARLKMVGVAASTMKSAREGVEQAGFEFATDNWKDLIKRDDIDIIEVCTPNYLHKEIILESIKAGKHINCEKPLAMDLAEAKEVLKAVEAHPELVCQMTFGYRYQPAMMRAKKLIEEGLLGRIYSARLVYLHSGNSDPNRPVYWKIQKKFCGGGSLYDLASHIIDLTRFLIGDFKKVFSRLEIFINNRPLPDKPGEFGEVDVDDLALIMFESENGCIGTIEASKVATGSNDEYRIEIHGEKGAIRFNSMQPNFLEVFDNRDAGDPIGGRRGFTAIETVQRYPEPANQFPGPKFSIGWIRYHLASAFDFVKNVAEGNKPAADIYSGYKVQEVLEASEISNREEKWIELPIEN
jgi:predicted dehydrogenase